MNLCGLSVAVGDAVDEVKDAVDLVVKRPGGRGAVRETAEWLLKEQGKWDAILDHYQGNGRMQPECP
jgi:3-deoxy-D-manno-octulosonate 8-phosphate phosphatase (KDO 8-P phosphatase)